MNGNEIRFKFNFGIQIQITHNKWYSLYNSNVRKTDEYNIKN